MTKWNQEQEAAYKAAKKANDEAMTAYAPLRHAREQAITLLGEVLGGMPRASDVGHAGMGSWAAERAKTLIGLLTPFIQSDARMARLEADLTVAAETLRNYEALHRAKLIDHGMSMSADELTSVQMKIGRNKSLADRFEATLGIKPEGAAS